MKLSDDATFRDAEMAIYKAVKEGRLSAKKAEELKRKIKELEKKVGNRTKQGLPADPYHNSTLYNYRKASEKTLGPAQLGTALAKAKIKARKRVGADKPSVLDEVFESMKKKECCSRKNKEDCQLDQGEYLPTTMKQCTCCCEENELTLFVLEEVEKGASALEIINKGGERGYDALRVAKKLIELLEEGFIYEPKKGELRIIG